MYKISIFRKSFVLWIHIVSVIFTALLFDINDVVTDNPDTSKTKESNKTWKGKMARKFKRYSSSSAAPAEITGTFGVPIELCFPSRFCEHVPLVVELCTSIVEERGMENQGVYRVPGNSGAVTALQEELNRVPETVDTDSVKWLDVNVVTSLLKSFFRKLPEPLITDELYELIINANRMENPEKRMLRMKKLLHELPDHNFETFRYIAEHLNHVAAKGDINKMDARNLAIVFGPTLVRTTDESMVTMVKDMTDQCRIVESIILHYDWFFSSWDVDNEVPIDEEHRDAMPVSTINVELITKAENLANVEKGPGAKEIVSSILNVTNLRKKKKDKSRGGGESIECDLLSDSYVERELADFYRGKEQAYLAESQAQTKVTIAKDSSSHNVSSLQTQSSSGSLTQQVNTKGVYSSSKVMPSMHSETMTGVGSGARDSASVTDIASPLLPSQTRKHSAGLQKVDPPQQQLDRNQSEQELNAKTQSKYHAMGDPRTLGTTESSKSTFQRKYSEDVGSHRKYEENVGRHRKFSEDMGSHQKYEECVGPRRKYSEDVTARLGLGVGLGLLSPPAVKRPQGVLNYQQHLRRNEHESQMLKQKEALTQAEQEQRRLARQRIEEEMARTQQELEQEDSVDDLLGRSDVAGVSGVVGIRKGGSDAMSVTSDYSTTSFVTQAHDSGSMHGGTGSSHTTTSDYSSNASPTSVCSDVRPCYSFPAGASSPGAHGDGTTMSAPPLPSQQAKLQQHRGQYIGVGVTVPQPRTPQHSTEGTNRPAGPSAADFNTQKVVNKDTVSRKKTHVSRVCGEDGSRSVHRSGSLDSLREYYQKSDQLLVSEGSDGEEDFVGSLTTAFDERLQLLCQQSQPEQALHDQHSVSNVPVLLQGHPGLPRASSSEGSLFGKHLQESYYRRGRGDPKVGIASRFQRKDISDRRPAARTAGVTVPPAPGATPPALPLSVCPTGEGSPASTPPSSHLAEKLSQSWQMEEKDITAKASEYACAIRKSMERLDCNGSQEQLLAENCHERLQEDASQMCTPAKPAEQCSSTKQLSQLESIKKELLRPPQSVRQTGAKAIHRRHTVGGTNDVEHFKALMQLNQSRVRSESRLSAWEQLRPLVDDPSLEQQRSLQAWLQRERLRSVGSSPALLTFGSLQPFMDVSPSDSYDSHTTSSTPPDRHSSLPYIRSQQPISVSSHSSESTSTVGKVLVTPRPCNHSFTFESSI